MSWSSCAFDDEGAALGKKILTQCNASVYKIAEKSDWKTLDMPKQQSKPVDLRKERVKGFEDIMDLRMI